MRGTLLLLAGLTLAAAAPIGCGSSGDPATFVDPNADGGNGDGSSSGNPPPPPDLTGTDGSTGDGSSGGVIANITSARIDPADATITLAPPATGTQAYRVLAVLNGGGPEVDITARSVFYVPDNYLVGGFPATR